MRRVAGMVVVLSMLVIACGDDGGSGSSGIGPAGGEVTLPGGPTVTVPAGALTETVTIEMTETIEQVAGAVTPVYKFEPEGLEFQAPVTVTFPIPMSNTVLDVYWSKPEGMAGYEELESTRSGNVVSAHVMHFSTGYVAPVTAVAAHHTYIVSSLLVPTTNTQARLYAFDLDGDQALDNQLGLVFATLESYGAEVSLATTQATDRGVTLILTDVRTTSFVDGQSSEFRTYLGATPAPAPCAGSADTTCRKHLDGSGAFDVAGTNPANYPLLGNFTAGTLATSPGGHAVIQVAFDRARPVTLNLIGARVKVVGGSPTAIAATSLLGGAVTSTEIDETLIPGIALSANDAITRDCTMLTSPGCGCAADTVGKMYVGLFDTSPADCSISITEVRNNSLIVSLFAPDVVIEGQSAVSAGFGFTAVAGAFTP